MKTTTIIHVTNPDDITKIIENNPKLELNLTKSCLDRLAAIIINKQQEALLHAINNQSYKNTPFQYSMNNGTLQVRVIVNGLNITDWVDARSDTKLHIGNEVARLLHDEITKAPELDAVLRELRERGREKIKEVVNGDVFTRFINDYAKDAISDRVGSVLRLLVDSLGKPATISDNSQKKD